MHGVPHGSARAHYERRATLEVTVYSPRRILVPVDYSDVSRAAISAAIQLAAQNNDQNGTRVIMLHVQENLDKQLQDAIVNDPDGDSIETGIAASEAAMREAAELEYTRAAEAGRQLPQVEIRTHVAGGDWVEVALQLIDEHEIDVIVAGTHGGPSGIRGWLFGSSTERLVHHATCSVFVVKPKGFPYLTD
jgi:nucleotide-binding universal stress UspA family protein